MEDAEEALQQEAERRNAEDGAANEEEDEEEEEEEEEAEKLEDGKEENQPQEQTDQDVSAKIQAIIACALEWRDCGEITEEVPIALTIATRGNPNGWAIVQAEADGLNERRKTGTEEEPTAAAVQTALEVWLVARMSYEKWTAYHGRGRQDLSEQMRQEEEK